MKKIHTKKGAASFYIVAFSTLLLSIIVASFATAIISEIIRSANNELSESAYDSALAGIEDAKAAYINYQNCINQYGEKTVDEVSNGSTVTCDDIIYYMTHPDCDMVAHILSRIGKNESKEVLVEETTSGNTSSNNLSQAYTCVQIASNVDDYRSNLDSANSSRLVKINLGDDANKVKSIRFSWYSDANGTDLNYNNFNDSGVTFKSLSSSAAATPPVISLQLIQTANVFNLSDFSVTKGNQTNRGMVFLVPTSENKSTSEGTDNYIKTYDETLGTNIITKEQGFLKSNDKVTENLPFAVYCQADSGKEFACSTSIEIPEPIGGNRNSDTFMFVVSIPYGQPDTDFAIELCSDTQCSEKSYSSYVVESSPENDKIQLQNTQISIDSTGRANDLFRRVETRMETANSAFPFPEYVVQLFGTTDTLKKDFYTTKEYCSDTQYNNGVQNCI